MVYVYLSPFAREMLAIKTPLNSFVAMILRMPGEPPCPWFGTAKPMTDEFSRRSQGAHWLQVHGLIELDPSAKGQRWIWSAKGRAYREQIRAAGVSGSAGVREFPEVPADST